MIIIIFLFFLFCFVFGGGGCLRPVFTFAAGVSNVQKALYQIGFFPKTIYTIYIYLMECAIHLFPVHCVCWGCFVQQIVIC